MTARRARGAALLAAALCPLLWPVLWPAPAAAETYYRLDMEPAALAPGALREDGRRFALRLEGGAAPPALLPDEAAGSTVLALATGPTPEGARADRAEVTIHSGVAFGRTWAAGLRVLIPAEVPLPEDWHLLLQCHQAGTTRPPPLSLNLDPDGALVLVGRGDADAYRALWRGPMPRGRWVRIALEFALGEGGHARLLLDGQEVAAVAQPLSWAEGEARCTLKAGLYRGPSALPFALRLDDLALGDGLADLPP